MVDAHLLIAVSDCRSLSPQEAIRIAWKDFTAESRTKPFTLFPDFANDAAQRIASIETEFDLRCWQRQRNHVEDCLTRLHRKNLDGLEELSKVGGA